MSVPRLRADQKDRVLGGLAQLRILILIALYSLLPRQAPVDVGVK